MYRKIITLLILINCSHFAFSQNESYTINVKDWPLPALISELEQRYDLNFSFRQEGFDDILISAKVTEEKIQEFLSELLIPNGIEFSFLNENYIVLKFKEQSNTQLKTITFCGTIYDQDSYDALGFANVYFKDQSIGTESKSNGAFQIKTIPNLNDTLYFSYIGYQNAAIALSDFETGKCKDVFLKISEVGQAYVVVVDYIGSGISLEDNGLSTNLNPGIIGILPGEAEADVLKSIQFLPGVSAPSSRISDIHIRGGTPDQNLISWEDIPMYHTAHYFGMVSSINPFIIKEAKVYRSGFSADYGGRIASVIDLKSTKANQKDSYLGVGSNMTHAYAYGNKYLDQEKNTSLTFSLRRSYTELLKTPTIKNITKINQQGLLLGNREVEILPDHITVADDINFLDANVKFKTKINKNNILSVSGLFAENNFSDEIIDDRREEIQTDSMELQSQGLNINYRNKISDKIIAIAKASYSSYFYDYKYQLSGFDQNSVRLSGLKFNQIIDKQLQLSGKYSSDNNQELEIGYHLISYDLDLELNQFDDPRPFNEIDNSSANLHSLYANFKNPITNKIGLNIGTRLSYFSELKKVFFEPRINLSYQLSNALTFHGNFGKHHQYIYQLVEFRGNANGINFPLWSLSGSEENPVQNANVYQLGFVFDKKGFVVDLQGYRRDISGLSNRSFNFSVLDAGSNLTGDSDVIGLDIMFNKRFNFFKTWLSYSLSKTTFNFPDIQEQDFASDFDQRHVLQCTNQFMIDRFEIGLSYQYASGLPYSLLTDFEPFPGPEPGNGFEEIYDGINNFILDPTHELNFSINYKFKPGKKGMQAYLGFSIYNVLNTENLYNRTFIVDQNRMAPPRITAIDKTKLLRTPNLSFRIEWQGED